MAKVGQLTIEMAANVARLRKDMDRAYKSVDGTMRKMRKSARALRSVLGAVAATLAAGRTVRAMGEWVSGADKIAKTADKIGLTVEALQELRYAAELTGVEQKTLDMAMQRFSRRVGEAANGSGELVKTLEKYNIAVKNSDGSTRALDAVLTDLAGAIQGAGSQQEKLRIAFKAFDSEGAALVNTLANGSEGLEQMRTEARRLGFVLDSDATAAAERVNDQFLRINRTFDGLVNKVMVRLLPDIERLADGFYEASQNAESLDKWIDSLTTTASDALWSIRQLNEAIDNIPGGDLFGLFDALPPGMKGTIGAWGELLDWISKKRALAEDQNGKRFKMPERTTTIPTTRVTAEPIKEISKAYDEVLFIQSRVVEQQEAISAGFVSGAGQYLDYAANLADNVERSVSAAFSNMEDAITEFAMTGKMNFKDFANSVISDMMRIMIQQSITTPLAGALGNILAPSGPSSASNLIGGNLYSGATAGEMSSFFSKYDSGGFIPGGSMGIVGEKGPEIVEGPANVTSRKDTAALLGGKTNVYINNYGDTQPQVDKQKNSQGGVDIVVTLEKELANRIQSRGGRLGKSLESTYGLRRTGGR